MKFGMNLLLWSGRLDDVLWSRVEMLREIGYDGVELPLFEPDPPLYADWGRRLDHLMKAIATLVEAEVSRFPENVGHVLGSRRLHGHQSLAGRLTYLAWKGRDVLTSGAAYCRRLIGPQEKSGA